MPIFNCHFLSGNSVSDKKNRQWKSSLSGGARLITQNIMMTNTNIARVMMLRTNVKRTQSKMFLCINYTTQKMTGDGLLSQEENVRDGFLKTTQIHMENGILVQAMVTILARMRTKSKLSNAKNMLNVR